MDRQGYTSRGIDISCINTHTNGPRESEWEIDQKTEVSANVWKENIPITCCAEDGEMEGGD